MRSVKKGATDQSVVIRIVDATDGTPETGVAYNTSGIDLWYRREGATKTSITEASLSALNDAHTDGGILHIGDGYYRLDLPDAAVASGANGVVVGGAVTGMIVVGCYVHLVDYDPQDAVRMGLTALPNAAANATGGLMTAKRGGTAQAGASTTITLDAGASSSDDFYIGDVVQIVGGTGAGQSRIITDYVGSTKVATVDTAWTTNPSSDSVFVLIPQGIVGVTGTDVAEAVLGATAASYDDAGTIGEKINDAGSAGDPWSTELPGSYGSGTAGKIVGDNLNATVSSRLASGSYTAPPSAATIRSEIDSNSTKLDVAVSTRLASSGVSAVLNTIRKNVARNNYMFKMVDATDLNTAETGLSVAATRSIDGGSFASCANSVSEVANGWYKINLAQADLNGDVIVLRMTATGAAPHEAVLFTQPT